ADPMGAVTAFRSCEAAGAPGKAFHQGVLLMRRELLKWAVAPWLPATAAQRVAQLDAARGVALCADLWETYRPGPVVDQGLWLALERRLRRPAGQALGQMRGDHREAELSRAAPYLAAVAALDQAPCRELCAEQLPREPEDPRRASDTWARTGRRALHRGLWLSVAGNDARRLPEAPSSPLVPVWIQGELRSRGGKVVVAGHLEARGIPTSLRRAAERFAEEEAHKDAVENMNVGGPSCGKLGFHLSHIPSR
ncbi:unnamed protein product, partial [Effrenium voratum]